MEARSEARRPGGHPVFVYYFVHVDGGLVEVERALGELLAGMNGWAAAAYREGEQLYAKIGLGGDRLAVAKTVRLWVGPPSSGSTETVIPLIWEATGTPGLFPRMDADLVVSELGAEITQLAFRGSYRPPLGAVGRALDRTVLHRVAEASVKRFVDRIAEALERGPSEAFSGAPPA